VGVVARVEALTGRGSGSVPSSIGARARTGANVSTEATVGVRSARLRPKTPLFGAQLSARLSPASVHARPGDTADAFYSSSLPPVFPRQLGALPCAPPSPP
jgi:hypothetical protein